MRVKNDSLITIENLKENRDFPKDILFGNKEYMEMEVLEESSKKLLSQSFEERKEGKEIAKKIGYNLTYLHEPCFLKNFVFKKRYDRAFSYIIENEENRY